MSGRLVVILVFLALLLALPKIWPAGFAQPPVLIIGLLAVAGAVVLFRFTRRG